MLCFFITTSICMHIPSSAELCEIVAKTNKKLDQDLLQSFSDFTTRMVIPVIDSAAKRGFCEQALRFDRFLDPPMDKYKKWWEANSDIAVSTTEDSTGLLFRWNCASNE